MTGLKPPPIVVTMIVVELISAAWCKACIKIKPAVNETCKLTGSPLTVIDFDELEEDEKTKINHLPLIRVKSGSDVSEFYTDTFDEWTKTMLHSVELKHNEDF